jgi:formylglycine-generating enzyme required for sulfatase activity
VSWISGEATLPDQGAGATYGGVAMNLLSWTDLTAYLDWAGLRPMSELEYEKAARGPLTPVSGEYAWGSTSITQATSISNGGVGSERGQSGSNCTYGSHINVQGPLRIGSFSKGANTRVASGGGFYGVMELSGNVWERSVTVGRSAGRSFEGRYHGNGILNNSGDPDVTSWPGTSAVGSGFRGGGWDYNVTVMTLSRRTEVANTSTVRGYDYGGRGVRSAP